MPQPSANPVAKLLSVVAGAILLILGFMFSLVLLGVVVVVGLGVWAWFWWKTRKLRQQIKEQMRAQAPDKPFPAGGTVIEGEAVIVEEEVTRVTSSRLPASPDRRSPD